MNSGTNIQIVPTINDVKMTIKQRKKDHVDLTVSGDSSYSQNTGFDGYRLRHNALPEVNFDEIETQAEFLGRNFSFPLFISSMTGGYSDAGAVNAVIASFCQDFNVPFGVGSQRIMLEDQQAKSSFSVVREKAPDAFIAANIGGQQLIGGLAEKHYESMVNSIAADAVIVHLNPLQELMQPEGDRNFKGILDGISKLVNQATVPVIVKETGAGITGEVAKRLLNVGVSVIDISGAGGTSWSKVENTRPSNENPESLFNDWGIPTAQCLREVNRLRGGFDFEIIASGGIRSGLDIAKALCLGADFTASAQPVIKAVIEKGRDGLEELYYRWEKQLKISMTLTGCERVSDLDISHLYLKDS